VIVITDGRSVPFMAIMNSGPQRYSQGMSLSRRILFALALSAVVGFSSSASATGQSHSSSAPITWLAAGDSYSAGAGLANTSGLCDQAGTTTNSMAYPQHAYEDLGSSVPGLDEPTFVACSGATSADFLRLADAAGQPEWTSALGRFDLVTFTFGGNNVDFAGIVTQCVAGSPRVAPPDPGHSCPSDSYVRKLIARKLTTAYETFLTKVANDVVEPGGNIVVLGYPDIVELPRLWPPRLRHLGTCDYLGTSDATQIRGDAGDLNASISSDVQAVNAEHPNGVTLTFLDVNSGSNSGSKSSSSTNQNLFEPSVGKRHNLCGSGPPWLNGVVPSDLRRSFHPSELGNAAEGRLLAELLPDLPGINVGPVPTSAPTTTISTAGLGGSVGGTSSPSISVSWGTNPAPSGNWMSITFSNFPIGTATWYCVDEGTNYGPYSAALTSSTETLTTNTCYDTESNGSDYVSAEGVTSNTIGTD